MLLGFEPSVGSLVRCCMQCYGAFARRARAHFKYDAPPRKQRRPSSAEIVTALLNLAEFMEHDDKRLPLDTRTLGALAEKCHAFAKVWPEAAAR